VAGKGTGRTRRMLTKSLFIWLYPQRVAKILDGQQRVLILKKFTLELVANPPVVIMPDGRYEFGYFSGSGECYAFFQMGTSSVAGSRLILRTVQSFDTVVRGRLLTLPKART